MSCVGFLEFEVFWDIVKDELYYYFVEKGKIWNIGN